MKTNLLLLQFIIAGLFSVQLQAQSFQKIFGHNSSGIFNEVIYDGSSNIYCTGIYDKSEPQTNRYGAVSKLNTSGNVLWYKGYLPQGFAPSDNLLIDSAVYANNAIYCFGRFFSTAENSGYCLLKLDTGGQILWSKYYHYAHNTDDVEAAIPKIISHGETLYALLRNDILKINLNGEITDSKKINNSYILRNIAATPSGQILVVGEFGSLEPKSLVMKFDSNLQLLNGFLCSDEFVGARAVEYGATDNTTIVGTRNTLFCLNDSGEVLWSKKIPDQEKDGGFEFTEPVVDIRPINSTGDYLVLLKKFFFKTNFPNNIMQNYILLGKLNGNSGLLTDFTVIKEDPFPGTNDFDGRTLEVDIQNNTYYIAGSFTTQQDISSETFNYVHRGNYNESNCNVQSSTAIVENDESIEVEPFSPELLFNTDIQFTDKPFITIHILSDVDNTYCSSVLSSESFSKNISVHPNPVNDYLNIENIDQAASILLTDITGKIIIDKKISENSTLDLSGLVKGIYVLTISFENGNSQTEKIIKL